MPEALRASKPVACTRLRYATYSDICTEVPLAELTRLPTNAITRCREAGEVAATTPIDFSNVVEARRDARDARAIRRAPPHLPESWWGEPVRTAELYAACLHDAVCFGGRIRKTSRHWHGYGQLLVADDRYLVDDSYCVRDRARSLPRDLLDEDGGEYLLKASLEQAAPSAGLHYLVGAVHGHFGHFILEGLSRLWLLDRLAERDDLRFVVYEPELGGWQLELLAAAGVPSDRIVNVTEPMRFERLIVPSRAYVLHRYTSQAQDDVWQKIGRRYPGSDDHRSVFLSRAGWRNAAAAEKAAITRTSSTDVQARLWERLDDLERRPPGRVRHRWHSLRQRLRRSRTIVRPIVNEHEIEALFASRGFAVVRPETLPVAEQIALVRSADRLAGAVGSAMYLAAFMRAGADVFLIAPPRFAFVDDVQIAHFRNARLAYVFGDEQESDVDPRFARWSVDLSRLASSVDAWWHQ